MSVCKEHHDVCQARDRVHEPQQPENVGTTAPPCQFPRLGCFGPLLLLCGAANLYEEESEDDAIAEKSGQKTHDAVLDQGLKEAELLSTSRVIIGTWCGACEEERIGSACSA